MEELMSCQVSDDRHSRRHPFDGEVDNRQSVSRPSVVPSGSDSPFLRVTENLTDHQVITVGTTDRHACNVPSLWPSDVHRLKVADFYMFLAGNLGISYQARTRALSQLQKFRLLLKGFFLK
ncbi:hypothetical protein HAX54_040279, partial [Datura stramonium]|nr:hypothetical protein [Datura stramonium]